MCILYLCNHMNCSFFILCIFFFFKQKTAYEMRISDWSSDVCSSDLLPAATAVLWHARQSRTPTGRKVSLGGCNHPQDTTWFMGVGAGRSPVTFDTVQAHRKVKGTVTRAG